MQSWRKINVQEKNDKISKKYFLKVQTSFHHFSFIKIINEVQNLDHIQQSDKAKDWIREKVANMNEEERISLQKLNNKLKRITPNEFALSIKPLKPNKPEKQEDIVKNSGDQEVPENTEIQEDKEVDQSTQEEKLSHEAITNATVEEMVEAVTTELENGVNSKSE